MVGTLLDDPVQTWTVQTMCGRYVITYTLEELHAMFGVTDRPNLRPSWNAAPTQGLPVIRRGREGEMRLSVIRWGLVPSWSKTAPEAAKPMINARSETAASKPMFRAALSRRRALVPANGFYEWTQDAKARQPWYITRCDGSPMVFAGLWERWGEGTERVDSFAILTRAANGDTAHLHDRCPVMIGPDQYHAWLDPDADPHVFFGPLDDGSLTAARVGPAVSQVRNDGPALVQPLAP